MPNDPVVAAATQSPADPAAVVAAVTATPAAVVAAPAAAAAVVADPAKVEADKKAERAAIETELRGNVEKETLAKFTDAAKKQADAWQTSAKTDAEIGGANFDATLISAKNVIGAYGNEAFKTFLNTTGLGNHPEMIRLLSKVAKAVGEDKLLAGGAGAGQGNAQKTAGEVLYPNQKKAA